MPDQGPLLYLAALLHDLGKVFGKPENGQPPLPEAQRLEDWRKKNCPPACSRGTNKCPVAHHQEHALRGAVYLLARGLPPELHEVAALVLSHHGHVAGKKTLCPDVFAKLSQEVGYAIEPDGRTILSAEIQELQRLIRVADQIASSASRVEVSPEPYSAVWCSPYWATCRPNFEPVVMGTASSFSGNLFEDWTFIQGLCYENDFFSSAWERFRKGLAAEFQGTVEARHNSPDVRLWTHAAFTAAVSLCYYRRQGSAPDFPLDGSENSSGLAVACLAFAGSERVAEVPSDGALRQVRGRAAFLSLLTSGFAYSLLHELGLPPECLLLCWDTGCFLLLNDTGKDALRAAASALVEEFTRFPEIASLRVTLVPVYVVRQKGLTLYLRRAMRQAWRLAAYGHRERNDCELVYAGRPQGRAGLAGASRCRVCGAPLSAAGELCPACHKMESLGVAVNQGKLCACGLHLSPLKAELPGEAAYSLKNLSVYVAPGGWPWRPPVGPGSPQQELERPPAEDRPKAKIGIALVRCGVVERLLSKLENPHLLPARLAECFRLADGFFEALHREEKGVWALRWSPAEALLMGRAEATLELLGELPELCKRNFGFAPEEMNLKAALAICPLDAPWREAADRLRSVLDSRLPDAGAWVFLADGAPFSPQLAVKLLAHARQTGPDGKYALEALQTALCRGLKPGGYDALEASSALILLEARAQDKRRQAVAEARKILAEEKAKSFWSTLLGTSPVPEDLLGWLQEKVESGQAAHALATLAVARRLLPG